MRVKKQIFSRPVTDINAAVPHSLQRCSVASRSRHYSATSNIPNSKIIEHVILRQYSMKHQVDLGSGERNFQVDYGICGWLAPKNSRAPIL
jgi:hypothetical protein